MPTIFRHVCQSLVRIDALRGRALEAIHDEVKWVPKWGENRIAGTVESRPDWVISRQRSWGVPLPVFYGRQRSRPSGQTSVPPVPFPEDGPEARLPGKAGSLSSAAEVILDAKVIRK